MGLLILGYEFKTFHCAFAPLREARPQPEKFVSIRAIRVKNPSRASFRI
jgi:hypothetical protein